MLCLNITFLPYLNVNMKITLIPILCLELIAFRLTKIRNFLSTLSFLPLGTFDEQNRPSFFGEMYQCTVTHINTTSTFSMNCTHTTDTNHSFLKFDVLVPPPLKKNLL